MYQPLNDPIAQNGVELRANSQSREQSCIFCGRLTYPVAGLSLFVQGTQAVLCDPCVRIHAPALLRLRDAAQRSRVAS